MDEERFHENKVCAQCIGNSYLKDETLKHGVVETCSYCENRSRTVPINDLAKKIQLVVDQCYCRTPCEPDGVELYLTKNGDEWVRKGIPVVHLICDLLESSEKIATDIQEILEECTEDPDLARAFVEQPFSVEAHYDDKEEIGDDRYSSAYSEFERRIKEESRFFSRFIRATLASVFDDLASLPTVDEQPLLITSGPGQKYSAFYRARVFQDPKALKTALLSPSTELGPPPRLLGSAGRMNAAGVSVFYGAENSETAVSEVRPPVGSNVVTAKFRLVRQILLLNVDALRSVAVERNIFDPEFLKAISHAKFLRELSSRLIQPVMPAREAIDYLPTQAIADYLANEHDPPVDGLLYESPQGGGANVVIFHRSSRVREFQFRPSAMVLFHSMSEDPPDPKYVIIDRKDMLVESDVGIAVDGAGARNATSNDEREITLEIDLDSIAVHEITRAIYQTNRREMKVEIGSEFVDDEIPF